MNPSAPVAIKIFGREPAAILGLVEAILMVLVVFSLGVTNESAGLLAAFISLAIGAYSAWATKDTQLGIWTGVAKAFLGLLVYYGVNLSETQTMAIVTVVPLVVGMWQRGQTTPVADPVDPSPPQVVESPLTGKTEPTLFE